MKGSFYPKLHNGFFGNVCYFLDRLLIRQVPSALELQGIDHDTLIFKIYSSL